MLEIPENPNFDDIEKYLKDSNNSDFINFILKDVKLSNPEAEMIEKHFFHYNNCISKLFKVIEAQDIKIKNLENSVKFNSDCIDKIHSISKYNYNFIKSIKSSRLYKLFM